MNSAQRREKIISILADAPSAITASALAEKLHVSRQVIVGDIALLRANGHKILSTPRGYSMHSGEQEQKYIFKIACNHGPGMTAEELYAIVDNGGELIDVIVEHPVYGQLTGQLSISSRYDADAFLMRIKEGRASLLSNLTDGVHLHTITCKDEKTAERIKAALKQKNIMLS